MLLQLDDWWLIAFQAHGGDYKMAWCASLWLEFRHFLCEADVSRKQGSSTSDDLLCV